MVFSRASSPSAASATTSTSSYMFSRACRPSLSTAWSSAMRTRIFRIVATLLSQGNADLHVGALARLRFDLQSPSEQGGAFLHPQDAPAGARAPGIRDAGHVEANAVILHLQSDGAVLKVQGHENVGRASVPGRIRDRLLADAKEGALHLGGQALLISLLLNSNL